jgi:hypothetical protein
VNYLTGALGGSKRAGVKITFAKSLLLKNLDAIALMVEVATKLRGGEDLVKFGRSW